MGASGHGEPDRYLAELGDEEWRSLVPRITVGESYFFRNPDHFRALVEIVVPEIANRIGDRPLRVLSAGCSRGEETYSLAMVLRELGFGAPGRPALVEGVDIDEEALARARTGEYGPWSLRQVEESRLDRHFVATGERRSVVPAVRGMVAFRRVNLARDPVQGWAGEPYDLIFCRNVLMYLTRSCARRVVTGLGRILAPGGALFLGDAETLRGLSQEFRLQAGCDTFFYRSRREGEASRSIPDGTDRGVPPEPPEAPWFETIRRASQRVASLREGAGKPRRVGDEPAPHGKSRGPMAEVLEHLEAGRVAFARALLQQSLARDDLDPEVHFLLASCALREGSRDEAVAGFRSAVYLDPEFALAHLALARMSLDRGDREDARRGLAHARELLGTEDAARIVRLGNGRSRQQLVAECESLLANLDKDAA